MPADVMPMLQMCVQAFGRELLPGTLALDVPDVSLLPLLLPMMLQHVDHDGDGAISAADFRAFMQWMVREMQLRGQLPAKGDTRTEEQWRDERWQMWWRAFDPEQTGELNKPAFVRYIACVAPSAAGQNGSLIEFHPSFVQEEWERYCGDGETVAEGALRGEERALQVRWRQCVINAAADRHQFQTALDEARWPSVRRALMLSIASPAVVSILRTQNGQSDCSCRCCSLGTLFALCVFYAALLPFTNWESGQLRLREQEEHEDLLHKWMTFAPDMIQQGGAEGRAA